MDESALECGGIVVSGVKDLHGLFFLLGNEAHCRLDIRDIILRLYNKTSSNYGRTLSLHVLWMMTAFVVFLLAFFGDGTSSSLKMGVRGPGKVIFWRQYTA